MHLELYKIGFYLKLQWWLWYVRTSMKDDIVVFFPIGEGQCLYLGSLFFHSLSGNSC